MGIIANFYEIYNFLSKEFKKEINYLVLRENYLKIIKIMSPVTPHFVAECLDSLGYNEKNTPWPEIEKEYLKSDEVTIVIQINGKKRSLVKTENNLSEADVIE